MYEANCISKKCGGKLYECKVCGHFGCDSGDCEINKFIGYICTNCKGSLVESKAVLVKPLNYSRYYALVESRVGEYILLEGERKLKRKACE